jgi:hypothetical protein
MSADIAYESKEVDLDSGVKVELKPSDFYIKKALAAVTDGILPLDEFIQITGYPINEFLVNNFFHHLDDDLDVYITEALIKWCKFKTKELSRMKETFLRYVRRFQEGTDYWYLSKPQYEEFYLNMKSDLSDFTSNKLLPHPDSFEEKGDRLMHLILTVDCFKMVMMSINSLRGSQIRQYYIALERLVKIYQKYQNCVKDRELVEKERQLIAQKETIKEKDDRIEQLMKQMNAQFSDIKAQNTEILERSKQTESQNSQLKDVADHLKKQNEQVINQNIQLKDVADHLKKQNEQVINQNRNLEAQNMDMHCEVKHLATKVESTEKEVKKVTKKLGIATTERATKTKKTSKHHKFALLKLNDDDEKAEWKYYVVRRQKVSYQDAIDKRCELHPNLTIELVIEYQPNAINFFNLVKEQLSITRQVIQYSGNYVRLLGDYTYEQLIEDIKQIDKSKADIEIIDP